MEEIKLRAWNKQEKIMLWRKLFDMNWYATPKNDAAGSHCWGPISGGQRNFLEVMQSTGLKDKNGEEIYQGDIVKHSFSPGCERIIVCNNRNLLDLIDTLINYRNIYDLNDRFEIIGNTYENPELLK